MTVTTEAAFYDEVMVEPGSPALLPLAESSWRPLYLEAAAWIRPEEQVFDLGCGTGRFGHALYNQQHYGGYVGVDFSAAAIDEASRYLSSVGLSKASFTQADLRMWEPDPARDGGSVFVCLETLEHLEDDVDLVRRVPPGHRLVFSVPNYDSEAHLRVYREVSSIWDRYAPLVTFRRWSLVDLGGDRKSVHLCDSIRRADSW